MLRKIATSKLSENAHHAAEALVFQVYAHPLVIHKKPSSTTGSKKSRTRFKLF